MYKIVIEVKDVADGDIEELCQRIWDEEAEGFDAHRGDFKLSVSKDGFPFDWRPLDAA
jgi:hypothetical protein